MELLFPGIPYEIDPRFREVDFGIFEMHSYDELKDTPEYQALLTGDNERNVPPEGESGQQMASRVLAAFAQIEEDTCLVTHGGVIAAIMADLFPEEGKHRYQWQSPNGHGYCIMEDRYRATHLSVETCERNIWLLQNLGGRICVPWMTSIVSKRDMKKPSTESRRFFQ